MADQDNQPDNVEQEGPLYTVGAWHDLPRYECVQCAWDTLELNLMQAHIKEAHVPPTPQPVSRIIPVYDRYGNLVNPEVGV